MAFRRRTSGILDATADLLTPSGITMIMERHRSVLLLQLRDLAIQVCQCLFEHLTMYGIGRGGELGLNSFPGKQKAVAFATAFNLFVGQSRRRRRVRFRLRLLLFDGFTLPASCHLSVQLLDLHGEQLRSRNDIVHRGRRFVHCRLTAYIHVLRAARALHHVHDR